MTTPLIKVRTAALYVLLVALTIGGALSGSAASRAAPQRWQPPDPNALTHKAPRVPNPLGGNTVGARIRFEAWMPAAYNTTTLVASGVGGTVTVRYFFESSSSNAAYYQGGTQGPDVTVSGPSILTKSLIPRGDADRFGVQTPVQTGIAYRSGDTTSNKWWPGCRLFIDGVQKDAREPQPVPEMKSTDHSQCYGYLK